MLALNKLTKRHELGEAVVRRLQSKHIHSIEGLKSALNECQIEPTDNFGFGKPLALLADRGLS